jgi:hypothetical protein
MDEEIYNAFIAELEKFGFNMSGLLAGAAQFIGKGGVPLAVGASGAGLALYDYLKARKIKGDVYVEDILGKTRGSKRVDAKEYVKELEKTIPGDRPLVSISSKKDVPKILNDPRFKKSALRPALKKKVTRTIVRGDNASMVAGKSRDFIVSPETVNPRVLEHEVGHARDNAGKAVSITDVLKGLVGKVWKPTYKKHVIGKEERAWEAAKPTPLRPRALATYERGFHTGRGKIMRRVAAVGLLRGLGRAIGG